MLQSSVITLVIAVLQTLSGLMVRIAPSVFVMVLVPAWIVIPMQQHVTAQTAEIVISTVILYVAEMILTNIPLQD